MSVGQLIAHYLPECLRTLRHPQDARRYAEFWSSRLGSVSAADLKAGEVEEIRAALLESGRRRARRHRLVGSALAPATVNRYVAFLGRVFNLAIRDDLATSNPCRKLRKLRENNTRTRALSVEEEGRLRAAMEPRHWLVVQLAMHTGMRRSELFGIRREDINLDTGFILVPRSKHGGHRFVALNSVVRSIIADVLAGHQADHLLVNRLGRPLDADNFMARVFVPALARAGIRDFHWHDLRHTFASRLAMRGHNALTLKELGGWKTLDMVLRYSHLSSNHLLAAVETLTESAPKP